MKHGKVPAHAVTVRTYRELDEYVEAFAGGHLNLLILVGPPGVQKSQAFRRAVGQNACWIEGHATPFGIYCKLAKHRDQLVVIDDVDGLYGSRDGVRLLKSLCSTEVRKTVCWQSNLTLQSHDVPEEFTTDARVALVGNEWVTLSANVGALEDRGVCLNFAPSPLEVHVRAAAWFRDQEIFDFVAAHLHCFTELSMRLYRQAKELKSAGMDWRGYILSRVLNRTACLVARLKADPSYATDEERIRAFKAAGGGCRQTFYNYSRRLKPQQAPPKITLPKDPPAEISDEVWLKRLRRFGPFKEC